MDWIYQLVWMVFYVQLTVGKTYATGRLKIDMRRIQGYVAYRLYLGVITLQAQAIAYHKYTTKRHSAGSQHGIE